jgi:hypothetical protein
MRIAIAGEDRAEVLAAAETAVTEHGSTAYRAWASALVAS